MKTPGGQGVRFARVRVEVSFVYPPALQSRVRGIARGIFEILVGS